jgi:hypothetical protein
MAVGHDKIGGNKPPFELMSWLLDEERQREGKSRITGKYSPKST